MPRITAVIASKFMSAAFDPYYKWLGIAPEEQPATLYRLLGVRAFEADADVIDTAADQRIRLLKSFQTGPHAALSQQLLNEVSRARQRLLDPGERGAYDEELRRQLAKKESKAARHAAAAKQARWPEGKAPATVDEFLECLAASGIFSKEEARHALDEIPADARPADPKALARLWLQSGKLTMYQAGCLVQGKLKYLAFGEYLILEKLGQGGMGQVVKAQHRRMKRIVALKLISGDSLKNPDSVRRFQREVQAAARLIHPNIVTAFDANEHEGMHYFVMEFVDGPDLGAVVKKQGPLPVERAVNCVLQAARGLAYAHGKGIVHRDMKPSNLLIDKEGTVKILDMGLARVDLGEEAFELTSAGQVLGTADYMAPEQALDTHKADARADIYSLGCTLHRLVTGEPLYGGETLMQKLLAHRDAPIPSLVGRASGLPGTTELLRRLDAIFQRMVAKRPEERQQSMAEVVADFEALDRGHTQQSSPAVSWAPVDKELNDFLSGISERGSSPSLSKSGSGSAAVAVAAAPRKTAKAADSEVTKDIKSGVTDRQPLPKRAVPPAAEAATATPRPKKRSASRLPAILVPVAAVVMLGLLAGSISLILKATTPPPAPPKAKTTVPQPGAAAAKASAAQPAGETTPAAKPAVSEPATGSPTVVPTKVKPVVKRAQKKTAAKGSGN